MSVMLWFNFILGFNFIFLCFNFIIIHYHTRKQRKIKLKPGIKLNHNITLYESEIWPIKLNHNIILYESEIWPGEISPNLY